MRKSKIIYLLVAGMVLFGLAGGAWAYTFNDNTLAQEWVGSTPGAWMDVIGATSTFDTFGANLSGNTFTIYTNWNPSKDGTVNADVRTADLVIVNSSGTYLIRLDTTGQGNVYFNPTIQTSRYWFASSGDGFGGKYDFASAKDVPVWTTSTSIWGTRSVAWTIGSGGENNSVAVDLTGLDVNAWSFVWATARCANDVIAGTAPVPEPAIILLLGLGLVGLAGLGRKFKN